MSAFPLSPLKGNLFRSRGTSSNGFTLIEILTVLSIIAILAVVTVPGVSFLVRSQNLNSSALGMADLINSARSFATMKQVYVLMGLRQSSAPNGIWVVLAMLGTTEANYSSSDVSSLQKPTFLPGINLTASTQLPSGLSFMGSTPSIGTDLSVASAGNTSPFVPLTQSAGGQSMTFDHLILFTPVGEALIDNSGTINHWINLGLTPSTGTTTNAALLQVCGLTSQCITYRQ